MSVDNLMKLQDLELQKTILENTIKQVHEDIGTKEIDELGISPKTKQMLKEFQGRDIYEMVKAGNLDDFQKLSKIFSAYNEGRSYYRVKTDLWSTLKKSSTNSKGYVLPTEWGMGDLYLMLNLINVIGGFSGTGKTTVMCNLIYHQVINLKLNVILFSNEMKEDELMNKLVAIHMRRMFGISCGFAEVLSYVREDDKEVLEFVIDFQKKIRIIDCTGWNSGKIISTYNYIIEHFWRSTGNKISSVFVDYFQRIRPENYRASYFEQVNETIRILTESAKYSNKCWVVLSQISTASQKENKKGVWLDHSNLKGSGNIAEDAGSVFLLEKYKNDLGEWKDELHILITKNKRGPVRKRIVMQDNKSGCVLKVKEMEEI